MNELPNCVYLDYSGTVQCCESYVRFEVNTLYLHFRMAENYELEPDNNDDRSTEMVKAENCNQQTSNERSNTFNLHLDTNMYGVRRKSSNSRSSRCITHCKNIYLITESRREILIALITLRLN